MTYKLTSQEDIAFTKNYPELYRIIPAKPKTGARDLRGQLDINQLLNQRSAFLLPENPPVYHKKMIIIQEMGLSKESISFLMQLIERGFPCYTSDLQPIKTIEELLNLAPYFKRNNKNKLLVNENKTTKELIAEELNKKNIPIDNCILFNPKFFNSLNQDEISPNMSAEELAEHKNDYRMKLHYRNNVQNSGVWVDVADKITALHASDVVLEDEDFTEIYNQAKNIQNFSSMLADARSERSQSFAKIPKDLLGALEEINLEHQEKISLKDLVYILQNTPNLKNLKIDAAEFVLDDNMSVLDELKIASAHIINFEFKCKIHENSIFLEKIIEKMPYLMFLNLGPNTLPKAVYSLQKLRGIEINNETYSNVELSRYNRDMGSIVLPEDPKQEKQRSESSNLTISETPNAKSGVLLTDEQMLKVNGLWKAKSQILNTNNAPVVSIIPAETPFFQYNGPGSIINLRRGAFYLDEQSWDFAHYDPNISVKSLTPYTLLSEDVVRDSLASFTFEIESTVENKYYALPAACVNDKLLNIVVTEGGNIINPDDFTIFHWEEDDLYYLKFKTSHNKNCLVHINVKTEDTYIDKGELNNSYYFTLNFTDNDNYEISVSDKIDGGNNKKDEFLALSLSDKINYISKFFETEFSNTGLTETFGHNKFLAQALLKERKGACGHRSFLFLVLAKYFDIEARAIQNGAHVFVEVKINGKWKTLDLGGGKFDEVIDLTEKKTVDQPDDNKAIKSIDSNTAEKEQKNAERERNFTAEREEQNQQIRDSKSLKKEYKNFNEFAKELNNNFIQYRLGMCLLSSKDSVSFHKAMLNTHGEKYHFIDGWGNVISKEGKLNDDNQIEEIAAGLVKFCQKHPDGTVIIHIKDIQTEYVAHFIQLADKKKIRGVQLPADMKILLLMEPKLESSLREDFYSRIEFIQECPNNILPPQQNNEANTSAQEPVLLFEHQTVWKEKLLGQYTIDETGSISFQKGALISALDKGQKELRLVNPPYTDEFKRCLLEWKSLRAVSVNGVEYKIPENFTFVIERPDWNLSGDVQVQKIKNVDNLQFDYVLNTETFPHFFATYAVKNNNLCTQPGWIEDKQETLTLLVTETLTDAQWSQLLASGKKFNLLVPPGVKVPTNFKENDTVQFEKQSNANNHLNFIVSNDLELSEHHIIQNLNDKDNVVTMYIEDQSYADLLGGADIEYNGKIIARQCPGVIFDALKAGKTVILKGHFSNDFIQQVSSLLHQNPYVWENGEKKEITGKLHLITDKKTSFTLPSQTHNHTIDATITALVERHSKENLNQMTELAKKLSANQVILTLCQWEALYQFFKNNPSRDPCRRFFKEHPQKDIIFSISKTIFKHPEKANKDPDVVTHRTNKIKNALNVSSCVFVSGPSGTGKSYLIQEQFSKDSVLLTGLDKLLTWAKKSPKENGNKDIILFIDEANLEQANVFNLFENMYSRPPFIILNGEKHELTDQHKIIFAGNPLSYGGGREYPEFFTRRVPTVQFKPLPELFLRERIIKPLLNEKEYGAIDGFMEVYNITNKVLKEKGDYQVVSPRDLQWMTRYFNEVKNNLPDLNSSIIAKIAAYRTLKTIFMDKKERHDFKNHVFNDLDRTQWREYKQKQYEKQALPEEFKNKFTMTDSRQRMGFYLYESLAVLKSMQAEGKSGTKGVLFEGESGHGKTKLVETFLQANKIDYIKLEPDELTIMREVLLQAVKARKVILIDELNTLNLEKELNALMSGEDYDGKKLEKPGFVIATQNPITMEGRRALSPALLNRFRRIPFKSLKSEELNKILETEFSSISKEARTQLLEKYAGSPPRELFKAAGKLKI